MLDEREILNIVAEELQQSAGGNENDFIDANRQRALASYLGQPNGKEVEGRSSITSTDVADAIEWIMPEIVKAFTQNNEVVTFDPDYDGDEDQAELESRYVYDILMKENNGFLIIHQFIKDALMQKNGFIKVFYNDDVVESTESYTGLTEPEYNVILADKELELMEETMEVIDDIPVFNFKVKRTVNSSKIEVVSVPPEEFRVNKMHPSVDLSTARFTAHVFLVVASDLIEQGYDKEFIDSIPTAQVYEDDREYRFYMQDETVYPDRDIGADPALRTLEIAECYMHMDLNEDGIAEMVKVTVAGGDNPDVLLDIEEIDEIPFISSTAILMSHKLFGLSIYDRLKEIQEQKTTLWRNIFDNMYLQNNQRTIVIEDQVNLDDLMVSRPGGIIRTKVAGAVTPYVTPPLSGDAYKMMDYLDQVRASRAGVSPDGPVTDSMIGDRVGSEGVERMMSQKEELIGLMIRVIAETGIKPLCYMIRNQVIRHQDVARDYMFRGQWVQIHPKNWRKRTNTTVRVGTGSGNRREQQAALGQIIIWQGAAKAIPGQVLVTPEQEFNALNDFAKFSGMPSARRYFLDPKSPQGQENAKKVGQQMQEGKAKEDEMNASMAQAQAKIAEAAFQEAQAKGISVKLKGENDTLKAQLEAIKIGSKNELDTLKQELDEAKAAAEAAGDDEDLKLKWYIARNNYRVALEQIDASREAAKDNNNDQ